MLGFPIIAIATDSLRLFPPDNVPDNLSSYFTKSIYLIFYDTKRSLCSLGRDLKS
jgi:hypothetical protein